MKTSYGQPATYVSTVGLVDEGPFTSFKDAVQNFFGRIRAMNGLSWQILETACWIERKSNGVKSPLSFYDIRDFSMEVGILEDGSVFNANATEPDPVLLADLYVYAMCAGSALPFIQELTVRNANMDS